MHLYLSYFSLQKAVPTNEGSYKKKQPKRKAKGNGDPSTVKENDAPSTARQGELAEINTWKGKEVHSLRNLNASKKTKKQQIAKKNWTNRWCKKYKQQKLNWKQSCIELFCN